MPACTGRTPLRLSIQGDRLLIAILLLVLTGPDTLLSTALSWRPLAAIGITSYFIYLFHRPIWYVLHWAFFKSAPAHFNLQSGAVTCLALVTTLLAAASRSTIASAS